MENTKSINLTNYQRQIKFITFGGPTPNFHKRVNEICIQASLIPSFFTEIKGFTDKDLKNDTYFWKKHGQFINSNLRGYGYWLWKPYLIKKMMDLMNDNDIIIYADAGCHLNLNKLSIQRLTEYISMIDNSPLGIISFQMQHLPEYKYTKLQTINEILDLPSSIKNSIIEGGQCMASVIILRKTQHTIDLINKWLSYSETYNLINDTKSYVEHFNFIDHRHDQSIYSLLVKKYGTILINDETYFEPNWNKGGKNYPFWVIRNRGYY